MNRQEMLTFASGALAAALCFGLGQGYAADGGAAAGKPGTAFYANSPSGGASGTAMRKFVDRLPGLGPTNANNLGQYLPIANADTITYPGSDYYEIGLIDWRERMHSDLPATGTLVRGYVQLNKGTNAVTNQNTVAPAGPHYLGPIIIAQKDRPVRLKFVNKVATGAAGNLFLPVDTTCMGAGAGPDGSFYTENRAAVHLHGGRTPWISDGTPHQWVAPAGEATTYKKGDSTENVPDMPDPGDGSFTLYWTNQQSARLMFYHDHAYGITRLNVYAGEAAGYLITDATEQNLVSSGVIPATQIPLVIQDRTFVPQDIEVQDALWDTDKWGNYGDLWFPHVYEVAQDPFGSPDGLNPTGRWDYGPWTWPISPANNAGLPQPSFVPESFMDTPIVNGTAYPYLAVDRKAYRFRILNACNDRFLNLQVYYADAAHPTEVKMLPAFPHDPATASPVDGLLLEPAGAPISPVTGLATGFWPATWPVDARDGGVPDPRRAGPAMIQIGTEGGFLPNPVVIPAQPYSLDQGYALLLGPAERADVIIDFSSAPVGSRLILYNDAYAPVPGADPRYDYFTGNPDQLASGGAATTLPGYGPNTRTIMQFRVRATPAAPVAYDLATLQAQLPLAYVASQPAPLVPQTAYPGAFQAASDTYARIFSTGLTFTPVGSATPVTLPFKAKAIAEGFDPDYGRITSNLGTEVLDPRMVSTIVPLGYVDAPTEILGGNEVQLWRITHNGVDTHAIHFHLADVQVVNRIGWDGSIIPPDANELGWKDTVRMNPAEDTVVAVRAVQPLTPFGVPDSIRPMDTTRPLGSTTGFTKVDPYTGAPVSLANALANLGWEYVWHCHILGHEENDMMRPLVMHPVNIVPAAPGGLTASPLGVLTWTDPTPPATSMGDPHNEIGFRIERATGAGAFSPLGTALANATTFTDNSVAGGTAYRYRVFAFNAAGASPASNIAGTQASVLPGAPTIGTASAFSGQARVAFTAPAINGSSPILSYTATSTPGGITATGNTSPITVKGLTNGTAYRFSVTATNAAGTGPASALSNSVTPVAVPSAPSNLAAALSAPGNPLAVRLTWTDNSTNEVGFRVFRATNAAFTQGAVSFLVSGSNVTTYNNTTVQPGTTYYYRVLAYNAGGNSAYSNVVTVTTP